MGVDLFPGIDKPTSVNRLGIELAAEQVNMIAALRQIRIESGLTIADVAVLMKVNAAQVSRFESGGTNPTMASIRRYAKAVKAVIRIETRRWKDEQTRMVRIAADGWVTSAPDDSDVEQKHNAFAPTRHALSW